MVADVAVFLLLSSAVFAQHYTQVNLDANVSGAAEAADSQLVNAWGLARTSGSMWWVSDEATGFATLYDGPGAKQKLVVTIPKSDPNDKTFPTGTPTGAISNANTTDFPAAPVSRRRLSSRRSMDRSRHGTRTSVSRLVLMLPPPTL